MISRAVYMLLTANSTLSGLVGTKIYPIRTPQTVSEPFLIYTLAAEPIDTKDGIATQELHDLQITFFSSNYETGQNIKAAVRSALDRKSGTYSSQKIQTIVFEDERDSYDNNASLYKFDIGFSIRLNK